MDAQRALGPASCSDSVHPVWWLRGLHCVLALANSNHVRWTGILPSKEHGRSNLEGLRDWVGMEGTSAKRSFHRSRDMDTGTVSVVILAAGKSHDEAAQPPPLLSERNGSLLLEQIFRQIDFEADVTLVLQREQAERESIDSIVSVLRPQANIVLATGTTSGAACSALLAIRHIELERELLLLNANEFADVDAASVIDSFRARTLDAGTIVFPSLHPRYCYARLDDEGLVKEVSEKRPISRNAVAGFFWWRRGGDFIHCATEMIRTRNEVDGQFYICPTLNEMILHGKRVGVHQIDAVDYHPLKTQAQSRSFEDGAAE